MALVRRLVELGRAARASSGLKVRQPLARAMVGAPGWEQLPDELRALLLDELNVSSATTLVGETVSYSVKPNFRSLGRRFGGQTPAVAAAVSAADPAAVAAAVRETGVASVPVDGSLVELSAEELVVTETPLSGWAVASAGGETVALDLQLTPALVRAGLVREYVRIVQEQRKNSGLDVSDRIEMWWQADDPAAEVAVALRGSAETIAAEVLAVSFAEDTPAAPLTPHPVSELGLTFWLRPVG
jgi:isoleucyl-tRNA synthetase